ncbi:WbqC family protein [Legionella erythra]|uniref:WbqC-like protein family protein n=1 Tax=Legionella erythra TaxID=448 RepID=A0A0W0TJA4_LEGER|nr:WbqC family protein [Legionella erythra]KTC95684.1 WbqC-like protein family protein [Legionella erythra]
MVVCAIHQPNFFPWNGYFDKIRQADVFIFLDEVAYPKSGSGSGSWCNRVKLLNNKEPSWYGLPIKKESGTQLIKDVFFSDKDFHIKKIKKSLFFNYKKAPFYDEVMAKIEPLLDFNTTSLAQYNMHAVTVIAALLGLKTRFVRQSELSHSQHATELLIELLKQVDAEAYLCGHGAGGYQNDELFAEQGIQLIYQNYSPLDDRWLPVHHESEAGLSILHSLFYKGWQ